MTAAVVEILLVEDNPTDVMMTREALAHHKIANPLHVAKDGVVAMQYLKREGEYKAAKLPGLIILDLNLPRKSGREVLEEIKCDARLRAIPVVVLTTSRAEQDILRSYGLHANCYIAKPVDFSKFIDVVQTINEFWFGVVTLPPVSS
jgi:CheY-like chemotaxis protein